MAFDKKEERKHMEFWKSFADDTHGGSSIDQRDQSAFGATRQFVALAMLMFLASCGSKKQVYYADAAMNEQTITAKGKSKKKDQKKKDKGVVYSSDPTTRYIQQYAAIAQEEMRRYKIPASITLAQGLLESQLGQGVLAQKSNNHFGIKCKREWKGKKVYHDDDAPGECFRAYKDPKESYRDHSLFLVERERYASLFRLKKTNYKAWAKGLKKAGYATDPAYAEKLIGLIERLSLWKYDNPKVSPDFTVKNRDIHIVQKGDTLYGLSKRYKISVDKLKKINGLTTSEIQIGQHILVEK
jgi:flagellum-specific peptidoglycan hydrolase FlgJ